MNITIDGVSRNWTIQKMAKKAKRTEIVIIHRLRVLGIKGVTLPSDRFFSDIEAKQIAGWDN